MSMTKDADTLSEQAEAQNDMTLIMKLNAFRRSAKEKAEEHVSLAKKIAKLCEDLQMWWHFEVPQLSVLQIPYSKFAYIVTIVRMHTDEDGIVSLTLS